MDELLSILTDLCPDVDFDTCEDLVDGHILGSLAIIALIAELEDTFDITIPTVEIIPENLNSARSMYAMITRLQEEG